MLPTLSAAVRVLVAAVVDTKKEKRTHKLEREAQQGFVARRYCSSDLVLVLVLVLISDYSASVAATDTAIAAITTTTTTPPTTTTTTAAAATTTTTTTTSRPPYVPLNMSSGLSRAYEEEGNGGTCLTHAKSAKML